MRSLVLIGGNDYCKSVIEAAESAGYNILGILDSPEMVGKMFFSVPIVGTISDIAAFVDIADFIIASNSIDNELNRASLYSKAKEYGAKFATIIASTAYVSKYAHVGEGSIIMHKVFLNADAYVGNNVFLDTFANVDFQTSIGNHSIVYSNTMINGDTHIGERCIVGKHSTIDNGVHICDDVIIEDNSVVVEDIITSGTYLGNPALLVEQK